MSLVVHIVVGVLIMVAVLAATGTRRQRRRGRWMPDNQRRGGYIGGRR